MNELFVHVGGDIILRSKEIIFILNEDIRDNLSVTNEFLKEEEKRKEKIIISEDHIKSIVVTNDKIYYSPVSTLTLNKRSVGKTFDLIEEIE